MKIIVTIKETELLEDDFEISGTSIDKTYVDYDLNEWDNYAIEEAVQISESADDVEVVTVTIGPERAEETIRLALAKGADRAIRIWDESLAQTDLLDVGSKAAILAAVINEEDPELVLSGVQAHDDSFGGTGIALANEIDYGWAAVVTGLDLDGDVAHVHRELEDNMNELVDVDLPAVFSIQTGINEPRYASLRAIRQAQRKEISQQTLDDLELDASVADSKLELTKMYKPEAESTAQYLEGAPDDQASELADILSDLEVVEG